MTSKIKRVLVDGLGITLIIIAIPIGWLPGPGGIPLIIIGLSLLARNNKWARDILDNFEEKWRFYNSKVTSAGPKMALFFDILVPLLFVAAFLVYKNLDGNLRYAALGPATFAVVLLLVNRSRFARLKKILSKTKA